jgi:hypothetical protein
MAIGPADAPVTSFGTPSFATKRLAALTLFCYHYSEKHHYNQCIMRIIHLMLNYHLFVQFVVNVWFRLGIAGILEYPASA